MRMHGAYRGVVAVAFLAMLVRALLPDGWMPSPHSDQKDANWVPFVICTSQGIVNLSGLVDGDDQGTQDQSGDNQHEQHYAPCPFAAAAHMGQVGGMSDVPHPQAVVYHPAEFAAEIDTPRLRDFFDRRRSRAPPFHLI